MSKKIVFIIGSLRRESFNRQLARTAAELIGDRARVDYLEFADVPYMNQDIEFPAPDAVVKVRDELRTADGIWIFTPEYNHQIPGVLKNLLDWLSRPLKPGDSGGATAVTGRAVTVSGAGGRLATAACRGHLKELLTFMRMNVMSEPETGVSLPAESFITGRLDIDEDVRRKLALQADAFLEYIDGHGEGEPI